MVEMYENQLVPKYSYSRMISGLRERSQNEPSATAVLPNSGPAEIVELRHQDRRVLPG
jgi:hypothetical protein